MIAWPRLILSTHLVHKIRMDPREREDQRDDDLHHRLALGDRQAFEELYRRYSPAAFGLAYRVTGQELLAQDVVHDSFLALWKAPEAFDPARGTFRTFFLSLRRRSLRVNPGGPEDEDVTEDVVEEAWLRVRRARVVAALGYLPREQREVLELAYFGGYTQARIAESLGIPLGTVKTRTLAALRKLQGMLKERDE